MPSVFSRIIQGELPCYKIFEDDSCIAFLDIHPYNRGHTLIVPKTEVDYFADQDDTILSHMMIIAKRISKALDQATGCKRTQLVIAGRDVPHTHIHLIPSHSIDDIHKTETLLLSSEEMIDIQTNILQHLGTS